MREAREAPGDWNRDETIVALDACPKRYQPFSRSPVVREVADLLGRSPGAVSRKFGNIWSLWTKGAHGLRNVGNVTIQVYREFEGREVELRREANRLRESFLANDPTPRVDGQIDLPFGFVRRNLLAIRRRAKAEGIDTRFVVTYARDRSVEWSLVFLVPTVLQNPEVVRWLIGLASQTFAEGIVRLSWGARLVKRRRYDQVLTESVIRNAPGFHYNELSEMDLRAFAFGLGSTGPLNHEPPERYARKKVIRMTPFRQRALIRTALQISDTTELCSACLLMAAHVADVVRQRKK